MANTKNLDLNNIKIGGKLYKSILIYYIGYLAPNSVKPLYHIINNKNGYIAESNVSKYLTLVPTDESKDKLKKYREIWSKTKDLTISTYNNADNYDEKYMKIKFNSDDENCMTIITVTSVFHEGNKYSPKVFLNDYLYKLAG